MTDLATAIETQAAHQAEVAAAAPPVEPITATIPTGPLKIAAAYSMWRAWWEDRDMWDGAACYVDRDTALTHAAIDYVGEEYGWPHPEDEDDEQLKPGALVWTWEHGAWHLSDGGRATLVQVYEERVYGPVAAHTRAVRSAAFNEGADLIVHWHGGAPDVYSPQDSADLLRHVASGGNPAEATYGHAAVLGSAGGDR